MPSAWFHPLIDGNNTPSPPECHLTTAETLLKEQGERRAVAGETDGKTEPKAERKQLKDFSSDNFWGRDSGTKFGLWIRDVATHL